MKHTLVPFQDQALTDVLRGIDKARELHQHGLPSSFGLTAATGAGKTVIASAVIEALFFGNEQCHFEPDESAVVLWFSQDPVLNRQTRHRIAESSDLVSFNRMVTIEPTFVAEKFDPGKVYFINTHKFASHSSLVRGHQVVDDDGGELPGLDRRSRPDARRFTIWDTIRNTIEDPDRTVYLFIDEAHQGMKSKRKATQDKAEKGTIVRRLINGHGDVPQVPIVFGISATLERFKDVMEGAENRTPLTNVEVDRQAVLESGLVKETVILGGKGEDGQYDTVLLRRGVQRLKRISTAWQKYVQAEKEAPVVPLMVLQVPNKPKESDLARWVETIIDEWDELDAGSFAHVFGEHDPLVLGDVVVPYIPPEDVQETKGVRVLLAKEAISTGWDCPRAEVMVSFRSVSEPVTITQLLGRLVRAPLRRHISGHGLLNSVYCSLPNFDEDTVTKVVKLITEGDPGTGEDSMPVTRVLTDAVEVNHNPVLKDELGEQFDAVMDALAAVPTEHAPRTSLRPVPRFLALAKEMSRDGLVEDAVKVSYGLLNKELAALSVKHDEVIESTIEDIETVQLVDVHANLGDGSQKIDKVQAVADTKTLADAFAVARRSLGTVVADEHVKYLLDASDEDDLLERLTQARTTVAAIGRQPDLVKALEFGAEELTKKWLDQQHADIALLSASRQQVYTDIKTQSSTVQTSTVGPVVSDTRPTMVEVGEVKTPLETFTGHVLSTETGQYPWEANKAEKFVLSTERARKGFLAWYRNPERGHDASLRVAYERDGRWRMMHPDFIFFFVNAAGEVVPAIVDPHGSQLSDSMPKLVGLARFAEEHGDAFARIDAVTDLDGQYVRLDVKSPQVREAIRSTDDPKVLFGSGHATHYGA